MDIYTIIFAVLAVIVCLRLYSVLGQRTSSERPSSMLVNGGLLILTAAAFGVVFFDVGRANWYLATVAPNGPARVIEGVITLVAYIIVQPIVELLWSLWDMRDRNDRPRYLTGILTAAVLCALLYVASQAKWYSALKAAVTPMTSISGPAHVVDSDTVVFVGILLAMALLVGAALVLSFLQWKAWKTQKLGQDNRPLYRMKTKPLDGQLRNHPSQRKADAGYLHLKVHQRRRIQVTGILLALTAAALSAVVFNVGGAKWFPTRAPTESTTAASATAMPTISGSARVIDGDTVVVAGVHVRLKGVDAAELGTVRGENARAVMIGIVTGNLTCRLTGEKTYRREVGYCTTANGIDINQAIIAAGAALACPRYDFRYLPFEQSAALAAQPRSSYCVKRH